MIGACRGLVRKGPAIAGDRVSRSFPADLKAAAALGGEMGRRLLAFDWVRHPLGDPSGWSATVRTMVAVTLASRFPTVLWLGDDLRLVYNDAA